MTDIAELARIIEEQDAAAASRALMKDDVPMNVGLFGRGLLHGPLLEVFWPGYVRAALADVVTFAPPAGLSPAMMGGPTCSLETNPHWHLDVAVVFDRNGVECRRVPLSVLSPLAGMLLRPGEPLSVLIPR